MPNLVALGQNGVGKNGESWPLPFDPYNTPLCTFVTVPNLVVTLTNDKSSYHSFTHSLTAAPDQRGP